MRKNAIGIMLDSLQHNYLGCYGNTWIKTPNIDALAREGVLFENAYSEGLPTIPVRRAMFTGRYTLPSIGWKALSHEDTTVADLCWGRPIDTCLVYDSAPLRLPKFGFSRSFDKVIFLHGHEADQFYYECDPLYHLAVSDYVEDHMLEEGDPDNPNDLGGVPSMLHEVEAFLRLRQYWRGDEDRHVARTMEAAIEYIERHDRTKSFFLWVDSFDPHEPWDPPSIYDPERKSMYDPDYKGKDMFLPLVGEASMFTEAELHHIRMLYAELVTLCDTYVGKFLDAVRKAGLYENTLILLTADHGEPMGHGEHGHGIMRKCRPWPYEELVHIPLIIRAPGMEAGKRVKGFAQSCDVAPTITDWLGIGVHPSMQGKSLLPLCTGEKEKVRDFAIAGYHRYSWSIITEDYSFIHWLREEEESISKSCAGILQGGEETMGHLAAMVPAESLPPQNAPINEQAARYQAEANLDDEAQWTCTPSSTADVPARDELYDRKKDPFQLHNIADKNPEKALELLKKLQAFMAELQAS